MGKTANPSLGFNLSALRDDCPEAFDEYDVEADRKQVLKLLTKAFGLGNDEGREALVASRLYTRLPQNLKDHEHALFEHSTESPVAVYNSAVWSKKLARVIPEKIDGFRALHDLAAIRIERVIKWRNFQAPDMQESLLAAKSALRDGNEVPGEVIERIRGLRDGILWGDEIAIDQLMFGLAEAPRPTSPDRFARCFQILQEGGPQVYGLEIAREQRAFARLLKTSG